MTRAIAVVSGASYGLGEAITKQLLNNGYKVYGISRTEPKIKNNNFIWLQADLTKDADLKRITNSIDAPINVLVNNAGTAFHQKALEYTDRDFEKMYNLNLKSPIKLTKILFPKMKNGLIINISSVSDRYPDIHFSLYGSSKAALNIYFETIAVENPEVKILNILPNYMDTPLQHETNLDTPDFDWSQCMNVEEVSVGIIKIILNNSSIETGSRIIIYKENARDGVYNPEKLWLYTTNDKNLKKIKK